MASKRRDGEARREALLDAALQCFAQKGLLATGIEQIRKAAGASPSSVYHLFGGLPDLTLALLVRAFERLFAELAVRVARARTAEQAVKALVSGHLDWVMAHPDEARFMYQAMTLEMAGDQSGVLQQRKAELLAPILEVLTPFVRKGELPNWSPGLLDVVMLGPSHEACRRWLAGADLDPAWLRKQLPALAWRSVKRERRSP